MIVTLSLTKKSS